LIFIKKQQPDTQNQAVVSIPHRLDNDEI